MKPAIVKESEKYIRELFHREIGEHLSYHDIRHTEYVASLAKLIGENSGLSQEEIDIATVAAWFHDSGFVYTSAGHEEKSQEIAKSFLTSRNMPADFIDSVNLCIEATKMPQSPGENPLARVVCDADMAYLSEDFYMNRTKLLRKEWNSSSETKMSRKAYYQDTVDLFNNHTYFTAYGKKQFTAGKQKNYSLLPGLLGKKSGKMKKGKKKKAKELMPGRGVESMFRLTARNQINLSSIADNKANILISINTIVLTVLMSLGMGKISDYPILTFPSIIFISTCVITIIFAILSTRPKISSGKFSKEDIHKKRINLLFFGNFYNMTMEEYEWAMKEMMADSNYLYSSMIRDQYSLGKVVSKKYRLLRVAYTIFMIGIIISSLLFAAFILFTPS